MKRTIMMVILVVMLIFCLAACGCKHEWVEATCSAPKTCKLCDKTEGEILPHQWQEATCTTPKTCTVGGETVGEALGHQSDSWELVKEPTCSELGSEAGFCNVCNQDVTRDVAMLDHTPGEWQVSVEATVLAEGTQVMDCTVCRKMLDTRSYEIEPLNLKPLKTKNNFKYDDFDKSWKYYKTYKKNYSDATESITLIMFSKPGGINEIYDMELRAGLYWKDESKEIWAIDTVELLVNDRIYRYEMTMEEDGPMAYTFLATETSYQMIQDIATSSKVKAKISYANGSTQELNLSTNMKGICNDIVKYKLWNYYDLTGLVSRDTVTVR